MSKNRSSESPKSSGTESTKNDENDHIKQLLSTLTPEQKEMLRKKMQTSNSTSRPSYSINTDDYV